MRIMYDSVDPYAIPAWADMVAGYVDGIYGPDHAAFGEPGWSPDGWARFPYAVKVGIAIKATTNYGQVADIENGDMTPSQAVQWVRMRRAAGIDPTVYCDRTNYEVVLNAFQSAGEPLPHIWLATLDGTVLWLARQVAVQYQGSALTGGNYDKSLVLDYWPGVDAAPAPEPARLSVVEDDGVIRAQ